MGLIDPRFSPSEKHAALVYRGIPRTLSDTLSYSLRFFSRLRLSPLPRCVPLPPCNVYRNARGCVCFAHAESLTSPYEVKRSCTCRYTIGRVERGKTLFPRALAVPTRAIMFMLLIRDTTTSTREFTPIVYRYMYRYVYIYFKFFFRPNAPGFRSVYEQLDSRNSLFCPAKRAEYSPFAPARVVRFDPQTCI